MFTKTPKMDSYNMAQFISCANRYASSIALSNDTHRVNAKSLLGIIALDINRGTQLQLTAEGPDESLAVSELAEYFV